MNTETNRNEKEPEVNRLFSINRGCSSDRSNVLGPRTLRTATLVEGHLLSLAKILKPNAFDARHVEKQIGSGRVSDETETLVSQPLDRTFRHRSSSSEM